jgi:hypothetical protein
MEGPPAFDHITAGRTARPPNKNQRHLADIEVVAQQVVQRAASERDPAARRTGGEQSGFGPHVAFSEVP